MAHTMTIDVKIVLALVEMLEYAIFRLVQNKDLGSSDYLKEQLLGIKRKIENERFGGGDLTCVQIDMLLKMLGGEDG
jgi:hypothetical protein